MRKIGILLLLGSWLFAQEAPLTSADYTSYGQMIYWKSLNTAEKKVFLHAFLYRTYEFYTQVKDNQKLKSIAPLLQSELVNPVVTIFNDLNDAQKDDLIFWIDKFYRNDYNKTKPFYEALDYAYQKLQIGDKSLYETVKEHLE